MECLECASPDNPVPAPEELQSAGNNYGNENEDKLVVIRRLKNKRTAALSATSKQRTRITAQMSSEENVHIVKQFLSDLDELFGTFQAAHEELFEHYEEEHKERECDYFFNKQSQQIEFKNQVVQWIEVAEHRLTNIAESVRSDSIASRSSKRSVRSVTSARERERLRLAEMMAEKSLLKRQQELMRQKHELDAANEELELEKNIAKSRAREKVYASMIEEQLGIPLMKSTPLAPMTSDKAPHDKQTPLNANEDNVTKREERKSTEVRSLNANEDNVTKREERKSTEVRSLNDNEANVTQREDQRNSTEVRPLNDNEANVTQREERESTEVRPLNDNEANVTQPEERESTEVRPLNDNEANVTQREERKSTEVRSPNDNEANVTQREERQSTERRSLEDYEANVTQREERKSTKVRPLNDNEANVTQREERKPTEVRSLNDNEANVTQREERQSTERRSLNDNEANVTQREERQSMERRTPNDNEANVMQHEESQPTERRSLNDYEAGVTQREERKPTEQRTLDANGTNVTQRGATEQTIPNSNQAYVSQRVGCQRLTEPNLTILSEQSFSNLLSTQIEQHKEMLSSHQEMAAAIRLPQPKVPLFRGDVIEYKSFTMAFDSRIKSKTVNSADLLYYLHQHLSDEPKELIEGCLHLPPEEGYLEARGLLDKEYGDPYKVSVAYTSQINKWPLLKHDDAAGLKRLSLFLVKCKNAMRSISYMDILNHTPHMQSIVQKLPGYLQSRWRERVVNIRQQSRLADFSDLVNFVEHAAETSNDPVYSREALYKLDERPKGPRLTETLPKKLIFKSKGNTRSLATTLAGPTDSPHGAGSAKPQVKCPICDKSHDIEECKDFLSKNLDDRKKLIAEKKLCFACYGTNHRSKGCTNKRICSKCSKPHPTTLHLENFNVKEHGKNEQKPTKNDVNSTCTDTRKNHPSHTVVLQAIIPVKVTSKDGNSVTTYALYDNGSSGSFITESLKEDLRAKGIETSLQLGTMHGHSAVKSFIVKDLTVRDLKGNNPIQLARCYTRHEIPVSHEQIPTPQLIGKLDNLRCLADAIPELMPDVEIGLLVGCDCPLALEPLEVLPSGGKGPFAMRLSHGWTVNGPLRLHLQSSDICSTNNVTVKDLEATKEIMTPHSVLKMFELDFNDHAASSDVPSLSKEDEKFLKIASEGVRLMDGHYELPLPFRNPGVMLPNNREQAAKRAGWQRKKMLRNAQYRADYTNFINDTITKGYASKVPESQVDVEEGKVWYIPHHGVYHPKKPEKIRVVFDCSAKYQGVSLNDTLLQGPNLTNSLVGVLTRFRLEPVAFMADIEQMFYQVKVPETQRNFLRFLWWPDGDLNSDLQEYQMNVHLFGAISSPSCANFALRRVCSDNEQEFDPETMSTVRNNFYVDDCLRSVKDASSAISLVKNVKQVCAKGGFNLTKFICNEREVLESIPKEQRTKEVKTLDLQHDELPIERALGVQWCVESDKLGFRVTISEKPLTRRGILSSVSSIYDPLGIVAPFTLVAKKLLQDLCRERKLGWDEEVPEKYLVQWVKWRRQLPLLESLALDRCLTTVGFGEVVSREVHVFSDASSTGYGAVAYLRQCDDKKQLHCSFLLGKARLAPVKATTIPRLELTAATVSARVGQMLKTELDIDPSFKYHTDSTTVLRYLANQRTRFKVFVANRVQTILNLSDASQWTYVNTNDNPADDASRGLDAQSLLDNQRWLNGPSFLWQPEEEWPQQPVSLEGIEEDPEVKPEVTSTATKVTQEPNKTVEKLIQHYSDWYRLKKAVAVYLRVRKVLYDRKERRLQSKERTKAEPQETAKPQPLSVREVREAELAIIRYVQSQVYKNEIGLVANRHGDGQDERAAKRVMKKASPIYRLDPYLDNGVLRVGGRISKADIPDESIHPVILPRKAHVTTLIINDTHKALGHAGRGHVLARLRERFWIVSANAAVRHEILKCVTCRRCRGRPNEQQMADLPKDRVTSAPPFTFTGVDYFGPYVIKDGRKEVKRYGALFTCLASRAVHIEISSSLETDSFIQALRRFIARRGTVRMIRSDNGTNFVGAQAELREAVKEMDNERIKDKLLKKEIEWVFNPPAASNFGGVWERQIRTTRRVLSGLLAEHSQRLDDESLSTLMCEVEAVINSRPLTFTSDDPDDLEPLTPNHLLTNKPTVVLPPPGNFQKEDVYLKRRWRRVQYLTNLFWSRWRTEYLATLQQRQKWQRPKRNLVVGDVVLIKEDNVPRNSWCMGIVEETEQDEKGLVRAVEVRTKTSRLRRPINKLVLLLPKEEQ